MYRYYDRENNKIYENSISGVTIKDCILTKDENDLNFIIVSIKKYIDEIPTNDIELEREKTKQIELLEKTKQIDSQEKTKQLQKIADSQTP